MCRDLGLFAATKVLRNVELQHASVESALNILSQLGEPGLRPLTELTHQLEMIDGILQNKTDESIFNTAPNQDKKFVVIQGLYAHLTMTLHYTDPSLVGAASIRMVELELRHGLSPLAPLAFAFYGETLAAIGLYDKACRMGTSLIVLLIIFFEVITLNMNDNL